MRNKIILIFGIAAIVSIFLVSCDYINYKQGQGLYEANCVVCHMQDGSGVAELYPSLNKMADSKSYFEAIPCIIRNGLKRQESVIEMVGLKQLSDVEINNIVNYLVNDMNDLKREQTLQQTSSILLKCK